MALSGSFTTQGYPDDGSGAPYYALFSWTATQNISNNTSTVSWTLTAQGGRSSGYHNTLFQRYAKVGNSVQQTNMESPGTQTVYNGTVIYSGTETINHNADGTGSFIATVKLSFEYWTKSFNSTNSVAFVLDQIPRNPATVTGATVSNSTIQSYITAGYSTSTLNISTTLGDAPSISTYVVKYGNTTLYSGSSSTPSFRVPNISSTSGSITYKVYVIDSYGMTSNTYTCTAFTAYKYTQGDFTSSPLSQRCLQNGTLDETGQYAKCQISFSSSKIGTNNITTTVKVTVNSTSGTATTSPMNVVVGNNTLSGASSYSVIYKLYDGVIGESATNVTSTDTISISFRTMNFTSDGKGVGIGQLGVSGYHDINNMEFRLNDGVSYGQMSAGFITNNHQDHGLYSYGYVDSNNTFHSDPMWLIKRDNTGAVSLGGNSGVYTDKVTYSSGHTINSQSLSVWGKVAVLTMNIAGGSAVGSGGIIFRGTIPAGFRPSQLVYSTGLWYEWAYRVELQTNGTITVYNTAPQTVQYHDATAFSIVYILA